jgi:hypothetical protein
MRLTLSTKHRRVLILTGDDIPQIDEDDEPSGYVRLDTGDLTIAPEPAGDGCDDPDSDYDRFGFGK